MLLYRSGLVAKGRTALFKSVSSWKCGRYKARQSMSSLRGEASLSDMILVLIEYLAAFSQTPDKFYCGRFSIGTVVSSLMKSLRLLVRTALQQPLKSDTLVLARWSIQWT